ncbi:MAG: VOC family protein [Bacteroidota bacterium]
MKRPIISGIQQIGLGNVDVYKTFAWYRRHFGMDVRIFDEAAEAGLMLPYTGGEPRSRHAVLAVNMQGGGGLEIWQYTSREPEAPGFDIQLGDTGICIARYKSRDVKAAFGRMKAQGLDLVSDISYAPDSRAHFYVRDLYGNLCEVVGGESWFRKTNAVTGGIYGCSIGVSDIDKARVVYSDILGYDQVVYDKRGTFADWTSLPGGGDTFRRVLLKHSQPRAGAFSRLLGQSEIELIQVEGRQPRPIFEGRFWGDLGYIHLCFDINGMREMRELCAAKGFKFTVDSSESFDMGEAAGHFSYIEDPDGTLIEFVETHKVPVLKKFNLYLNLKNRKPEKPLPNWMVRSLAFNRVKD